MVHLLIYSQNQNKTTKTKTNVLRLTWPAGPTVLVLYSMPAFEHPH